MINSGVVQEQSDLDQSLALWNKWMKRAEDEKLKISAPSEQDIQAKKTRLGQENMLRPLSKKRTLVSSQSHEDGNTTPGEESGDMGSEELELKTQRKLTKK
jgi:hypothetical protein